jgi:hypothetical protein
MVKVYRHLTPERASKEEVAAVWDFIQGRALASPQQLVDMLHTNPKAVVLCNSVRVVVAWELHPLLS